MNTRALIATVTMFLLLAGCVSRTPFPSMWDERTGSSDWCAAPEGAFTNAPVRSTPEATETGEAWLELKQVFFGDELNGFDITHLSFDSLESGTVVVKPWIGERVLKEEALIERKRGECNDGVWLVKSEYEALPGAAVAGLLWTGGILIPMATRATFELELSKAGDLTVHAIVRISGTTFILFPMRTRDADEWFVYERWMNHQERARGAH